MKALTQAALALGLALGSAAAAQAQVYIGASVNGVLAPGVFGRVDIGNLGGTPPLYSAQPVCRALRRCTSTPRRMSAQTGAVTAAVTTPAARRCTSSTWGAMAAGPARCAWPTRRARCTATAMTAGTADAMIAIGKIAVTGAGTTAMVMGAATGTTTAMDAAPTGAAPMAMAHPATATEA